MFTSKINKTKKKVLEKVLMLLRKRKTNSY